MNFFGYFLFSGVCVKLLLYVLHLLLQFDLKLIEIVICEFFFFC